MSVGIIAVASWSNMAMAGSGPWTLEPGEHNVYVGTDYFRYASFRGDDGEVAMRTRITSAGGTAVWTFGMAYGLEGELDARYESVRVRDPADAFCTMLDVPDDWCAPTHGLGDVGARLKWRFLDEAFGAPFSASVHLGFRSGEAYANRRGRLTTLGDGSTDLGGGLSVGRAGTLGASGWYQMSIDATYFYRFANQNADIGRVPTDEVNTEASLLVSLRPSVGIGPTVAGFWRVSGRALRPEEADFFDPDYWGSLQAAQLKVGGKLGVYSIDNGPTISVSVLQTVWARNNPADTLSLSLGIGQWVQARNRAGD
ncbi:MAG: hypothetical protein KTR31_05315 [Myxococcales bacterium]|nr:hypothetical protein [Myxococcales bacterium]